MNIEKDEIDTEEGDTLTIYSENGQLYCFDNCEIPSLSSKKINPYTNNYLSESFLRYLSYKPLFVNKDRFSNKIVLITGGTSGIGLATAIAFVKNGAKKVIVCGRSSNKWKMAKPLIDRYLGKLSNKIKYRKCDVRIESQVKDMINTIYDKYGRLDIAFNNAGVQPGTIDSDSRIENTQFNSHIETDGSIIFSLPPPQPYSSLPKIDDEWRKETPLQSTVISEHRESEIATSVIGVYYCLKWEIEAAFHRQPTDISMSIICTSSRNGIIPDPKRTLYAASKAFIIGMVKSLSNQTAQRFVKNNRAPVRVNAIAPGPIDTPLERAAYPGSNEEFTKSASQGVPMQRVGQPNEIAQSVLFLADDKTSSYITGIILPIDGGDVASPYCNC